MGVPRLMHEQTHLLDNISNVRTCEGKILKRAGKTTIVSRVGKNRAGGGRYFGASINGG